MFKLNDLTAGSPDGAGRIVDDVFCKTSLYAIYRCSDKVAIQFSDDEAVWAVQVKAIMPLLVLRSRLEFLLLHLHRAAFYRDGLARALQVALDGDTATAKLLIESLVAGAIVDRARVGRQSYLSMAGSFAAFMAAALISAGGLLRHGAAPSGVVLLAAGGGALGALLSILTAIDGRAVMPGLDRWTNGTDGVLRVLTGAIGGFAICLFLSIGLVPQLALAAVALSWQGAVAVGFVAGFLERLVPDLLSNLNQNTKAAVDAPRPVTTATTSPHAPDLVPVT